ncbi:scabin-related ADP-ribosyltransferase [Yokenella regensburgei]|uniref:scabin-related ADP-ribosyltransferase n=1 Tax=Yokenella regensburgei TaxID=158877 RepID=UPI001375C1AA|nr:enterotoxin A family protein [Yokenella regensburgei]KAF1366643.1 hypothetical protein FHR25_004877 [Yokenella regensburgei]
MKSFISIVLSSSLFISSSSFAWANDVPNTGVLYRVDTRSPDEIFAIGFRSFGGNDSIRDHSRGVSCVGRNENSAFISTSSDPEYAGNYARRLYSQTSAPVYVYIITSRSNFYNMALSLENSGYTAGIGNARTQSEWIAYNSIPNTTIRGVRTYTGSSTPPVVTNPSYDDSISPEVNRSPYIPQTETNANGTINLQAETRPFVSVCMAATLSCFRPNSIQKKSTADSCNFIEPYKTNTLLMNYSYIL